MDIVASSGPVLLCTCRPPRVVTVVAGIAALASAVLSVTGDAAGAAEARSSATSVIDRTYACPATLVGGLLEVQLRAHAGSRSGKAWARLPYVVVASGNDARRPFEDAAPASALAWITAGSPSQSTTVDDTWLSFTPRVGGTVGVNRQLCNPSTQRIPLAGKGLVRQPLSPPITKVVCEVPQRVLVRISSSGGRRNRAPQAGQTVPRHERPGEPREAECCHPGRPGGRIR